VVGRAAVGAETALRCAVCWSLLVTLVARSAGTDVAGTLLAVLSLCGGAGDEGRVIVGSARLTPSPPDDGETLGPVWAGCCAGEV
jgi:hypothetical protein